MDRYKRQKVDGSSWIHAVAREFDIDELEGFLMKSTALMLLRRLLSNARWYENRFPEPAIAIERFDRDYLLGTFGFRPDERKILVRLVVRSLDASAENIPQGLRRAMKDRTHQLDRGCDICGSKLDFDSESSHSAFSLDHIWPRSLGGVSDEWNLRVTCKSCNENRQSIIEACDTHYEHFQVKSDWSADKESSFWKEFNWGFRIAAIMQAEYKCEMCGTPITNMVEGHTFIRRDNDESYHMFNVKLICAKHGDVMDKL